MGDVILSPNVTKRRNIFSLLLAPEPMLPYMFWLCPWSNPSAVARVK